MSALAQSGLRLSRDLAGQAITAVKLATRPISVAGFRRILVIPASSPSRK